MAKLIIGIVNLVAVVVCAVIAWRQRRAERHLYAVPPALLRLMWLWYGPDADDPLSVEVVWEKLPAADRALVGPGHFAALMSMARELARREGDELDARDMRAEPWRVGREDAE